MVHHHVRRLGAACALLTIAMLGSDAADVGAAAGAPVLPPALTRSIRSGDLVFRIGVGWRAEAVRTLSRFAFSHVGVALVTGRGVDVVHAAPPEEPDPGGVVVEPLATFASPLHAKGIAIFRRKDVDAATGRRMAEAARRWAVARVPFDDRFDLADGGAVYCTELVLRASATAGAALPVGSTSLGGTFAGDYVLPRDLFASGRLRLVGVTSR